MWAWVLRFLGGFVFWKGSTPYERLGKILFVVIICVTIMFIFWKCFLQKTIANIQHTDIGKGSNVTYSYFYYYQDCSNKTTEAFSLFKLWRFRLVVIK